MENMIDGFREYLEKGGLSASTIECYLRDVYKFLSSVSAGLCENALDYIEHLEEIETPKSTVARTISSLKSYFKFQSINTTETDTSLSEIKPVKIERNEPEILGIAEIEAIFSQPDIETPDGMRDRIALELAYQTGLSVNSLLALNVDNVNLQTGVILIKSDGKEKIVPIAGILPTLMNEYIAKTRTAILKGKNERALLINMRGGRLTRQSLWRITERYAEMAGIEVKVTPIVLRNSFCAHMIDNGADAHDIRDVRGMADASASALYSAITQLKYKQAIARAHLKQDDNK